jgi:hypothetical protein
MNQEKQRLNQIVTNKPWKKWGPYILVEHPSDFTFSNFVYRFPE